MDEAEAFKAAGNKFFKEKNYADAIKQYDKGKISLAFPGSCLKSSTWPPAAAEL